MGLLLSVLVQCIGVIEVLACYEHFRYSIQERRTQELLQIKHNLQREFEIIDEHNQNECSTCEEELLEQLRQTYEETIFANELKNINTTSTNSNRLEPIEEIVNKEIDDEQAVANVETLNQIVVSSLQIQQGIIIGDNFLEDDDQISNDKISPTHEIEEEYVPIVEGESLLPLDTSTTTIDEDVIENTKDQISSSVWTNDESVSEIQSIDLDNVTLSLLNNEIENSKTIITTEIDDPSLIASKDDIQSESLVVNFSSSKDTESETDTTWLDEDKDNLNDTKTSFWSEKSEIESMNQVNEPQIKSFWGDENVEKLEPIQIHKSIENENKIEIFEAEEKNAILEECTSENRPILLREKIEIENSVPANKNTESEPKIDNTEFVVQEDYNVNNDSQIESFWEEEKDEIEYTPETRSIFLSDEGQTKSHLEAEKVESIESTPELHLSTGLEVQSLKDIESLSASGENQNEMQQNIEEIRELENLRPSQEDSNNNQESFWSENQDDNRTSSNQILESIEDNLVVNVIEADARIPLPEDKVSDVQTLKDGTKINHLEVNVAEEELSNATDLTDLSDESEAELQFENKDSDPEVIAPNEISNIAIEIEDALKEDEIDTVQNSDILVTQKLDQNIETDIDNVSSKSQYQVEENSNLGETPMSNESVKINKHRNTSEESKSFEIEQESAMVIASLPDNEILKTVDTTNTQIFEDEGVERPISSEIIEIGPAFATEIQNVAEESIEDEEKKQQSEKSQHVEEEISEEVQAVLKEFEHVSYEPPEEIELIRTPEIPNPADIQINDEEVIEEIERIGSPDIPEISEEQPYVVNFVFNPTGVEDIEVDLLQNDVGNVSNDFSSVHYNIMPQVRGAPNEILEENLNTLTDELSELSMFTETDLSAGGFQHGDGAFYLIDDGVTKTHVYIDRKTNSVVELIPDIQHDQLTIQDYHGIVDRPASPYPPDELTASNKNKLHIPDSVIEGELSCDEEKNIEEDKDETKDVVKPLSENSDAIREHPLKLSDKAVSLGESSDDVVLFEANVRGRLTKRVSFAEDEDTVIPPSSLEQKCLFEDDDDNGFLKPDQNSLDIKWDNSSSDEIELPKCENEDTPSKIPILDVRTESLESEYNNQNVPSPKQRENLPDFWNRTITSQNASLEQTSSVEFPGSQNTSIDQHMSLDLPLNSQVNIQENGSTLKKQITLATDLRDRFAKMDSSVSVGSENQSFDDGAIEGFVPQSTISIQQKQLFRNDSAETKPLNIGHENKSIENQSKIFVKNYDGGIQCFIDDNVIQSRRKSDTICIKEPDGTLKCFETVDPENIPEDIDLEYKKPQHVKCIVINDIPICEIIRNNNDEPIDEETIRNQRVLEIDVPVIDPEDISTPNVSEQLLNSLDGIKPSSSLTRDLRRKFRNRSSSPNSSQSSSRSSRSSRDEELRMFTSLEEQEQGISQTKIDELLKQSTENLNENIEAISSTSVLSSPRLKRKPNSYRKTRSSENLSIENKTRLRHSPSKQRHQTVDLISDHDVIHEDVKLENQLLKNASDITTTHNELNKISDDEIVQNIEKNTNSSTGKPFWVIIIIKFFFLLLMLL